MAKRPEAETSVAIYTQSLNEEDPLYLQLPFETDETWFQLWIDQNYAQDEHTGINAGALYLGAYPPGQDVLIQLVVRDQLLRLTRGRGLFPGYLGVSAMDTEAAEAGGAGYSDSRRDDYDARSGGSGSAAADNGSL